MLMFQRDIALAAHLDQLGFDEFWCGEHHSSGWETIASPEMFLAAAGQQTHTIMLGTGVVSLPYHHPFNVAQRMAQLDRDDQGPGDVRLRSRGPAVRRPHPRHRPGAAARPPGRGARRHHPAAERRGPLQLRVRLVRAPRRPAADPAGAGAHADGDGVVDLTVGHADRRQVRHRRAVDRVQLDRGHQRPADAVGLRRGGGRRCTARPSTGPTGGC